MIRKLAAAAGALALAVAGAASATVTHYYYDALGRLVGVTADNSQLKSYVYDSADNRGSYKLAPAPNASNSQQLLSGQSIFREESLVSSDGAYVLTLQTQGNLVLYHGQTATWWTSQANQGGSTLLMQPNGALQLLDPQQRVLWTSNTSTPNSHLVVQTSGQLQILDPNGNVVWTNS